MALQLSREASASFTLGSAALSRKVAQRRSDWSCSCGSQRTQALPISSSQHCQNGDAASSRTSKWARKEIMGRTDLCILRLLRRHRVGAQLVRRQSLAVGCQEKSPIASALPEEANVEQVGDCRLSRRQLAKIVLFSAVLLGSPKSTRAEETLLTEQSQNALEGTGEAEPRDELLDSEKIKVSGGSRKTGLESDPTLRRYRAEDFSINVPRAYVNVTDEDDNPRSTLTMEQKAANRPFAARFTSPDQTESITVVIRDASTLRLSFLQTKDISDLGPIDKAAQLLLPPGAKLLKSRIVTQEVERQELEKMVKSIPLEIDTKLVRNYYQYEFYARGQVVALTSAAQNGKVYVVGATVPAKKYKELAKQMRAVVASFELR